MEYWIMTLILMRTKLKALSEVLDKRIDAVSMNPGGKTEEVFNDIMYLVDKRSKLINLKVLFDEVVKRMSEEEKTLVRELARFKSYAEISETLNVSKAALTRMKKKFLIKAEAVLNSLGYNAEVFKKEYESFKIVKDTYYKIKRFLEVQKSKRKTAS